MIEFCVFFVLPFDEHTPGGEGEAVIEHARVVKEKAETELLEAYRDLIPEEKRRTHRAWTQSRVDLDSRVIGVSLRLPIEKAAEHHVVESVVKDDFLYWDFNELMGAMSAMHEAGTKVAATYNATCYTVFDDVRYHY